MKYSEKLKDPRWQRKRLEILNRDDFACRKCGDTETTLHIHHKKYVSEPWECPSKFLETLCENCHAIVEELKSDGYSIRAIYKRGPHHVILVDRGYLFFDNEDKKMLPIILGFTALNFLASEAQKIIRCISCGAFDVNETGYCLTCNYQHEKR